MVTLSQVTGRRWKQNLSGFVVVVTADFPDTILACPIGTQNDVPLLNSLGDSPQGAACQTRANLGLVWMRIEIDRDKVPVKRPPLVLAAS